MYNTGDKPLRLLGAAPPLSGEAVVCAVFASPERGGGTKCRRGPRDDVGIVPYNHLVTHAT